jgi:hypothetical protein
LRIAAMNLCIRNTRVGFALFAFFFVACGGDDKVGVTVHIGGAQDGSGGFTGVPGPTGGVSSGTTGGTSSTTGGTSEDGGAGAGEVKINVGFNTCPNITIITIDPVELEVGGDPAELAVEAVDEDDDQMSVFWSASSGYVTAPAEPETTYTCTVEGTKTITVTITDSNGCSDSAQTEIECQ